MKQIIFIFSFLLVGAFSADAQSCSKSATAGKACCASKKSASATTGTSNTVSFEEADAALASNENVTKRTCEISGATTYYQMATDAQGVVSWEEVQFDATTKSFTKVASASMEKDPATGEVKEAKACCSKSKGAKACAGQDSKTSCAKKEGAE